MKIAIITGPRQIAAGDEQLVRSVVREVITRGFKVYVGDAAGVDDIVSQECFACDSLPRVFEPVRALGRTPAGLAERSTRMVKEALHDGSEVLAIGFPNKPCPSGIIPARSWRSGGSGTWSTLALAAGHKIETIVVPLGSEKFSLPWGLWDNAYDFSVCACYRFKRAHNDLFNSRAALSHDELAQGWTEYARANSAGECDDTMKFEIISRFPLNNQRGEKLLIRFEDGTEITNSVEKPNLWYRADASNTPITSEQMRSVMGKLAYVFATKTETE